MAHKILLVEDEAPIAESVAYSLNNEGFDVAIASDGVEGMSKFRSFSPHLIILDLMLPRLSGIDLCKIIRRESPVPIIMLTARTEEVDRVVGLEIGADDYICKPFSMRELIARVRSVLRRTEDKPRDETIEDFTMGNICVSLSKRRVVVDGKPVHLPLKQFEILKMLILNKDKVVTREELFNEVWGEASAYNPGSLDVHIRWLREKIEADPGKPRYILTVRGIGYRISSGER